MTTVPYTFGNESSPIPLSQLDANFAVTPNYANTAGNVVNGTQANITGVGTLTSLSVAGNVKSGNINNAGSISTTGNVQGGNLLTGGLISAFGSVTSGAITSTSDIHAAGVITAVGSISGASVSVSGTVIANGNITGGNITTAGKISAGGNITTIGNVNAQGIVSATGNIVTAQYFVGNFLGNITGNLSVGGSNTQILFNQNGNVGAAGGLTYNSGSNVLTVLGVVSAQGNVIGGNLSIGGNANISGSASITGAVSAAAAQFTGVVTAPTANVATSNNQVATTAFVNNKVGTLGTMAYQNSTSVSITGGTIGNGIITSATISNSTISVSNISNVNVSIANISNSSITNGSIVSLVNPLSLADGGTSVSSFAQNAVLLGNSGDPFLTVAPGTNGNVLTSNGTTWNSVALPASPGLGFGGTSWHQVSRSFNTAYVNSHPYPIAVSATATCSVTSTIQAYVSGILVAWYQWQFNGCGSYGGTFIIVPPGATYQLNSGQGVYNWVELY
jgi:hypothetical protein